jgi:hypothetical protein
VCVTYRAADYPRATTYRVCIAAVLLGSVVAACGKSPTEPSATITPLTKTTFSFTSEPASLVGRGESPTYTLDNASFQTSAPTGRVSITVLERGEPDWTWRFVIESRRGQALVAGVYEIGRDIFFELSGRGRSCGLSSGTVTINEIDATGFLQQFHARFSVSCNSTPAVNGLVVINWVPGIGFR